MLAVAHLLAMVLAAAELDDAHLVGAAVAGVAFMSAGVGMLAGVRTGVTTSGTTARKEPIAPTQIALDRLVVVAMAPPLI